MVKVLYEAAQYYMYICTHYMRKPAKALERVFVLFYFLVSDYLTLTARYHPNMDLIM